jgi:hypothetical protein
MVISPGHDGDLSRPVEPPSRRRATGGRRLLGQSETPSDWPEGVSMQIGRVARRLR